MLNRLSVFLAIFIFLGGQCFYGIKASQMPDQQQEQQPNQEQDKQPDKKQDQQSNKSADQSIDDIAGIWYAVMTTGCTDNGPCNIFTNNKEPCGCISANFIPLDNGGYLVFMNSVNNITATLTVDMGGAEYMTSDSKTEVQGFIYSRATMPLSVVSSSEKAITENVNGCQMFYRYKLSIIGSSLEYFYMITTMTGIDGGQPLTVIWCRKRFPGRETIWTKIVQNLKALSIQARSLSFISQDGCRYPTENQCGEMFFC